MESIVLVIHLIVAFSLVAVVLLQQSEGGGLGIGGGGGGLGNFAGQRSTADFLTRLTTILGAVFVATSLLLAVLATQKTSDSRSILDIPGKDAAAIQSILNDDTIGVDDVEKVSKDIMSDAPSADGIVAVPPTPNKISEKPSAPVSK